MKKKNEHARFWSLLKQTPGYDEEYRETIKEGWVTRWTGGQTASLSEMIKDYPGKYKAMMAEMERVTRPAKARDIRSERSNTLKLMQKAGCDTTSWNKVDEFIRAFHLSNKKFYDITMEEHPGIRKQLYSIIGKDEKRKTSGKKECTGISPVDINMLNSLGIKLDTSHVQGYC